LSERNLISLCGTGGMELVWRSWQQSKVMAHHDYIPYILFYLTLVFTSLYYPILPNDGISSTMDDMRFKRFHKTTLIRMSFT
jgi:hypothetical protein